MKFLHLAVAVFGTIIALPALASDIAIEDAYARSSSPSAKAGAAFMTIINSGNADDRLVGVASDIAARVELHTHIATDDGIMQMRKIEGGVVIPAGGQHELARGGDHVMFMGLAESFEDGKTVTVTFEFENAGEIAVDIPVDLSR